MNMGNLNMLNQQLFDPNPPPPDEVIFSRDFIILQKDSREQKFPIKNVFSLVKWQIVVKSVAQNHVQCRVGCWHEDGKWTLFAGTFLSFSQSQANVSLGFCANHVRRRFEG